jgi:hypothetical protein
MVQCLTKDQKRPGLHIQPVRNEMLRSLALDCTMLTGTKAPDGDRTMKDTVAPRDCMLSELTSLTTGLPAAERHMECIHDASISRGVDVLITEVLVTLYHVSAV